MPLKIRKTDEEILSDDSILSFYEDFLISEFIEFAKYKKYYAGDNVTIMSKKPAPSDSPDNRIPISYARKLIKTVVGYMYKPGNIIYNYENIDEGQIETIKSNLKANKENILTSQLGKDSSNYGIGYEYFYLEDAKLRFIKISPLELIPIWSYEINPKLKFVIRFITKGKTEYLTVYSADMIREYYIDHNKPDSLIKGEENPNLLGILPFNIYKNNEEYQNDYYHVLKLVDAYDALISGSFDEFERFAYAYLRLVKMKLQKEDVQDLKKLRIFQNLDNKDAVSFLTKDIPVDFINWMSEFLRKEIHTQTHIPDFKEASTGKSQVSGEALDRLLYDFEFIASEKESYFKDALMSRIKIVMDVLNLKMEIGTFDKDKVDVKIDMKRNKPKSRTEDAALYNQYYKKGFTDETLMKNFAPFVEDPEAEIEEAKKEDDVYNTNNFDIDNPELLNMTKDAINR